MKSGAGKRRPDLIQVRPEGKSGPLHQRVGGERYAQRRQLLHPPVAERADPLPPEPTAVTASSMVSTKTETVATRPGRGPAVARLSNWRRGLSRDL